MVTYGFLIRVSREFLPYPVRWHWAHASILELVNRHWINFGLSLSRTTYDMPTSSPERLAVQGLVSAHMSLTVAMIIFMMLHAVFLQYYFLPFVTEAPIKKSPLSNLIAIIPDFLGLEKSERGVFLTVPFEVAIKIY